VSRNAFRGGVSILNEIDYLRQKINEIDEELVSLFIERMAAAIKIGEYKAGKNLKIHDPAREMVIVRKFSGRIEVDFDMKYVEQFLENLMFLSRRLQKDVISRIQTPSKFEESGPVTAIGYQGEPGCYSDQVGLEYFGEGIFRLGCRSFRDVFEALGKGEIQYGILPIENSTSGSINEVYDLLREYDFQIVGEKYLKVEHNLLGIEGAELSDIKEVYSHQQGLIQCRNYLSGHPEWKQKPYYDTAGSAEYIAKEGLKSKACIAGKNAASLYGLRIISENIQDNTNNSTRFVIIGKKGLDNEESDKVSIVISVSHKPGTLYGILKYFAEASCNLMKLESRPLEGKAWEYFFYVDFSGNLNEETTKNVLKVVEKECLYFRLLGNYKSEAGFR